MNKPSIFSNPLFGDVRMVEVEGKPLFVGVDVARALMYAKPSQAVIDHCKGIRKLGIPSQSGTQETNVIPEGDVYRLIAKAAEQSRNQDIKEMAEKFESWIFDEVLPTIRRTGGHVSNDDLFLETYLPFADDQTRIMFRTTLATVRQQNELIKEQRLEIDHKETVIIGLVDDIDLATKRQVLNRVVRKGGMDKVHMRWTELYKQFELKYHLNLQRKLDNYNEDHKPKLKNKLDYIEKVLGKVPELYEIAAKLYENDVRELISEIYELNQTS
ncbi:transporter [Paenibacillus sp. 19GGS1-52]|uniref:BRO-N domain-containing protein n=1 Tax=Paenibacillus sp. 19GGS1-52 TaxID=2758563 RepID=UPI001EFA9A21|nr:BRO family protein [Paenibacillus sp. 19GGS1-52]ULO05167.1 transporter [Paenibacillus sp. 19GGS1-52]